MIKICNIRGDLTIVLAKTKSDSTDSKYAVFHRGLEQDAEQQPVGPLFIESLWAEKQVSTGALEGFDDPLVIQTNS